MVIIVLIIVHAYYLDSTEIIRCANKLISIFNININNINKHE